MNQVKIFKTEKDTLEKVLKIFGKSHESLSNDVATVRKWMENQPHFTDVLETKAIENFLFLNKCDIEVTKQKIDMYYTVRSRMPHLYGEINPKLPHMKELSNMVYVSVYPQLTDQMYRIFLFKIHNKELVNNWEHYNVHRFLINIQEVRLREDIILGDIPIIDAADLTFQQQVKLTPKLLYESFILVYKNVYSIRVKGMYIINAPSYFEKIIAVIKKIISPKVAQRIHMCSDTSILKEHFPLNIIPEEYGGTGMSLKEIQVLMNAKLDEYGNMFDRLDQVRINEELRPEKLNDDVLGYYGNFRKLDFD